MTKLLFVAACNLALVVAISFQLGVEASSAASTKFLAKDVLANMDANTLLRHAVKVDSRLQKRFLQDEDEEENEQEGEEEGQEEEQQEQEEQEQQDQEEQNQEEEQQEEEEEGQEQEGEENQEEGAEGEDEAAEMEEQMLQINFLKCGAFSVNPNVMDVDAMVEAGEIDEEEAAELKNIYITEVTSYLATQESVVFFTLGYGQNDENRQLFMTPLDKWISASMGYDEVCHQLDENDVATIFSAVQDGDFVSMYSQHVWYSGFNCMEDGSGFESQLFLDETCTTYSPVMSYYYPFADGQQVQQQQEEAEAEEGEAEEEEENADAEAQGVDYSNRVASDLTPYMMQNADYFLQNPQYCEEGEGENNEEGNEEEMNNNQLCQNLFETSVDVVTCQMYGEEGEARQEECECQAEGEGEGEGEAEEAEEGEGEGEEDNQEEEDRDEEEGEEGQEENNQDRKKRRRNAECECAQDMTGDYQLSYDVVGDVQNSCSSIQRALQVDPDTFSDIDVEMIVSKWRNGKDGQQPSSGSNNAKWWILGAVLVALVATVAFIAVRRNRAAGDSKTEPLVSTANKPSRINKKKKKESIEIYFQESRTTSSKAGRRGWRVGGDSSNEYRDDEEC